MKRLLCLFGGLLLNTSANATDWTLDATGSSLQFTGSAQGEAFEGRFQRFSVELSFDPATPADCRFAVEIELASADTANAERDELLHSAEFFASAEGAPARYQASRCEALADGRFRALGELNVKGVSQSVVFDFGWTPRDAGAELLGEATLDRLAFGIGTGDWADTEMIAAEVRVSTRLRLRPR